MKQCSAYFDQISSFVDGELSETEQIGLFIHLETCPSCQRALEMYRDMSGAFAYVDVAPPAGFSDRVMEQVTAMPQAMPVAQRHRTAMRRFVAVAAVFAVVAVIGVGSLWGNFGGDSFEAAPMSVADESLDAALRAVPDAAVAESSDHLDFYSAEALPGDMAEYPLETEDPVPYEEDESGSIQMLDVNTTLLDTFLTGAPWHWDALSALLAGTGHAVQLWDGGMFEVTDPYNPGSLLYGQLTDDPALTEDVMVTIIGYQFVYEGIDRRVEVRLQDGMVFYYYNVTGAWAGGTRAADWESLRNYILHG